MDTQERIKQIVDENPVVLFMKGNAQFPMCGFSGRAVQIVKACGVDEFKTVNVLEDDDIRQGIKEFSNWPTIPQLYVNGEFVGGSEIMREMSKSGNLQRLFTAACPRSLATRRNARNGNAHRAAAPADRR